MPRRPPHPLHPVPPRYCPRRRNGHPHTPLVRHSHVPRGGVVRAQNHAQRVGQECRQRGVGTSGESLYQAALWIVDTAEKADRGNAYFEWDGDGAG
jgi:hypothetical protein